VARRAGWGNPAGIIFKWVSNPD